jgi:Family of unknown function (DUF6364)
MNTKLTLNIDKNVLISAKAFAEANHVSVSQKRVQAMTGIVKAGRTRKNVAQDVRLAAILAKHT